MQAAFPPKQCGTNHRSSNQNCIRLHCCNKRPLKVEQKSSSSNLWYPVPPIFHNYYFPRLNTRPLPLPHFWSCEFLVLMVLTGQHTCYMEKGASFSPQAAGGWTRRPLLCGSFPGPPPDRPLSPSSTSQILLSTLDKLNKSAFSGMWWFFNPTYSVIHIIE